MSDAPKTVGLVTHSHPPVVEAAVRVALDAAAKSGCELIATSDEIAKHGDRGGEFRAVDDLSDADACLVLGGDGSILHALRRLAGSGVPVFAINFGTVGFLAAVEPEDLGDGLERLFTGGYEVVDLPGLEVSTDDMTGIGLNDVTFSRMPHGRVAELSYRINGEVVGDVRCDGLVASTPVGSTGYNLANNGPILAWGVSGYAVSYISPHTLTARALVVAPGDVLEVGNAAGRDPVDLALDGEQVGELGSGEVATIRFKDNVGKLGQVPGASFYHRIRVKFGHLAH